MSSTTVEESRLIMERMQRLRSRLDDNASLLAASTHEMLDWKTYARKFPVGLLATGVLSGVLLAPRRKTAARGSIQQPHGDALPPDSAAIKDVPGIAGKAGLVGGLLHNSFVPWLRGMAWSYVKGFAMVQAEQLVNGLKSSPAASSAVDREAQVQTSARS